MAWHDMKMPEPRAQYVLLLLLRDWDKANVDPSALVKLRDWNEARDILTALRSHFPLFVFALHSRDVELSICMGLGGNNPLSKDDFLMVSTFLSGYAKGQEVQRNKQLET
jgi:hypothetical protein